MLSNGQSKTGYTLSNSSQKLSCRWICIYKRINVDKSESFENEKKKKTNIDEDEVSMWPDTWTLSYQTSESVSYYLMIQRWSIY